MQGITAIKYVVLFVLAIGGGVLVAVLTAAPEESTRTVNEARRAEAERRAALDRAQQAALLRENEQLTAEFAAMLALVARDDTDEPSELWREFVESERRARLYARLVRTLAEWATDEFGRLPRELRARHDLLPVWEDIYEAPPRAFDEPRGDE